MDGCFLGSLRLRHKGLSFDIYNIRPHRAIYPSRSLYGGDIRYLYCRKNPYTADYLYSSLCDLYDSWYEFIIGIIKIAMVKNGQQVSFDYFLEVVNSGLKTGLILMALALGIIFPILFFNTRTVKDKDLTKIINKKVIRKFKIFSRHHH